MARGLTLDKMAGRIVTVHTDREDIPNFGILVGYDDQGVMLHIPSELVEAIDQGGASADASLIFVPWRIVEYVATNVEEAEEDASEGSA